MQRMGQDGLICSKEEHWRRVREVCPQIDLKHGRLYYPNKAVQVALKGIQLYAQFTNAHGEHDQVGAEAAYSAYMQRLGVLPDLCMTYDSLRRDQAKAAPIWTANHNSTQLQYYGEVFLGWENQYSVVSDTVSELGDAATELTVKRAVKAKMVIPDKILDLFFRPKNNVIPRIRRCVREPQAQAAPSVQHSQAITLPQQSASRPAASQPMQITASSLMGILHGTSNPQITVNMYQGDIAGDFVQGNQNKRGADPGSTGSDPDAQDPSDFGQLRDEIRGLGQGIHGLGQGIREEIRETSENVVREVNETIATTLTKPPPPSSVRQARSVGVDDGTNLFGYFSGSSPPRDGDNNSYKAQSTPNASTTKEATQQGPRSPSKEELRSIVSENPLVGVFVGLQSSQDLANMNPREVVGCLEFFLGSLLPSKDDPSYQTIKNRLYGSIGSFLSDQLSPADLTAVLVDQPANGNELACSIVDTVVNGLEVLQSISSHDINLPDIKQLDPKEVENLSFRELVDELGDNAAKLGLAYIMLEYSDHGLFVEDAPEVGGQVLVQQRVPFSVCHILEQFRSAEGDGDGDDFTFGVYTSSIEDARPALDSIVSKTFADHKMSKCSISSPGIDKEHPMLAVSDSVFGQLSELHDTHLIVVIQKATIKRSQVIAATGFGGSIVFDRCSFDAIDTADIVASFSKIAFVGCNPGFSAIQDGIAAIKTGGVEAILFKDVAISVWEQLNALCVLIEDVKKCGVQLCFINTPGDASIMATFKDHLEQKSLLQHVRIEVDPNQTVDIIRDMGYPIKNPPEGTSAMTGGTGAFATAESSGTVSSGMMSSTGMGAAAAAATTNVAVPNTWGEIGLLQGDKWKCKECFTMNANQDEEGKPLKKCLSCVTNREESPSKSNISPTTVVESPDTGGLEAKPSGGINAYGFNYPVSTESNSVSAFSSAPFSGSGSGFSFLGSSETVPSGGFSFPNSSSGTDPSEKHVQEGDVQDEDEELHEDKPIGNVGDEPDGNVVEEPEPEGKVVEEEEPEPEAERPPFQCRRSRRANMGQFSERRFGYDD